MHIGIDGRFIQGPNTGVTNYIVNLLKALSRIDKDNTYSIFLSDPQYNGKVPQANNFSVRVNSRNNAFIWKNIWFPREAKRLKIDVVHFPAYTGSFANICDNVVTIHDLIHKINPDWFCRRELLLIDFPVQMAIKKAKKIIAVSQNTKRDIIKYYRVPEKKIAVTLEAADSSFRPNSDKVALDYLRDKYALNFDFILYVGVLFRRRNIPRLLKAFSLVKEESSIGHKLVIVGLSKKYFNLKEYIDKYRLNDSVRYLGYLEEEDLPLLYNAASFFIYPSLYEGFGLPVLEAMSCGKAVITSCLSSLPEVVGDAGILVNPYNTEELYDAMYRLIKDTNLRKGLEIKALARSKIFSWDKMAKETLAVYQEL